MLIFKLLKRHARNRVHQAKDRPSAARVSPTVKSTAAIDEAANSSGSECNTASTTTGTAPLAKQSLSGPRLPVVTLADDAQTADNARLDHQFAAGDSQAAHLSNNFSDGIYRVPEPASTFGTRYIIGVGNSERQQFGAGQNSSSSGNNNFTNRQLTQFNSQVTYATPNQHHQTVAGDGQQQRHHQYSTKPLYC